MGFRRKTAQVEQPKQQSKVADKGSSSKAAKSSSFVKFATLMQTKDGERSFVSFNDPTDDKYAKFEEILVDGRKVKGISTSSMEEIAERLVKAGHITEEEAQERLDRTPSTILGEITFILED